VSLPAIAAAPAAFAATALLYWCNRHLTGFLPYDPPGEPRKQHAQAMALAGVAMLPVVLAWLVAADAPWLAVAATLAAGVGFWDDRQKARRRDFDWRIKAVLLFAASACASNHGVDALATPVRWAIAVLFVFVLTNASNFLDNTDGVCCSLAAASLLCLSRGDGPLAGCAFAALGFLPWNWPRPRVFTGDSGALMLGVLTGGAAVSAMPAPGPTLLPVAVQLADFAQVVAARIWLGLPPWIGDRRHLTHVVQNTGLPRIAVAPLFAAVAAALGCLAR
jgi:UDP-GlcNAc:undecaprenyl-phosphate GlcNAc-1-phosphate transferase